MEKFWIYILTNQNRTVLYVGITNDLQNRLEQHVNNTFPDSFTAKYHCHHLIHIEEYSSVTDAIAREKQIKGWKRERKWALVHEQNPQADFLEV